MVTVALKIAERNGGGRRKTCCRSTHLQGYARRRKRINRASSFEALSLENGLETTSGNWSCVRSTGRSRCANRKCSRNCSGVSNTQGGGCNPEAVLLRGLARLLLRSW